MINLGLQRITTLLTHLSNPHLELKAIHIAGTNGKGSVSVFLDCILQKAGFRTGRYNSPHLVTPRDTIAINGRTVALSTFETAENHVESVNSVNKLEASPFELLTATALQIFAAEQPPLDVAIIEVGMGGRDDATNVFPTPLISVITSIDLDHQAYLGNTIQDIARAKGGIMKSGRPCVIGSQKQASVIKTLEAIAGDLNSPVTRATELLQQKNSSTALLPNMLQPAEPLSVQLRHTAPHHVQNATTAAVAVQIIAQTYPEFAKISSREIVHGIESARWPGRLDEVSLKLPNGKTVNLLVDGAHNAASALALNTFLRDSSYEDIVFILALSGGRDPSSILEPLVKDLQRVQIVSTEFSLPVQGMPWVQSTPASEISKAATKLGMDSHQTRSLQEALETASKTGSKIVVAGSLYLVSDVYRILQENATEE